METHSIQSTLLQYWKPFLVVLLALLVLRLLPDDSVMTVEPEQAGETSPRRSSAPPGDLQSVAGIASSVAVGQRFASLELLTAEQMANGYVRTGTFGKSWPATVTEVLSDSDAITFTRKDGTRHSYKGFDGYRMQVVRLSGPSQAEVIVVFRSANKR